MICCRCGEKNRAIGDFCTCCGAALRYPCSNGGGGTSTGMAQNTAALLAYLAWWITGIIFYFTETNKYVKFHAMQSMLTFGSVSVLLVVIRIIRTALWGIFFRAGGGVYFLLSLLGVLSTLVWIGGMVLWVILMVKANQGETFKLPIVGDIAEKQLQ